MPKEDVTLKQHRPAGVAMLSTVRQRLVTALGGINAEWAHLLQISLSPLLSPEDSLPLRGSTERLAKGDLQSGPAGAEKAELAIERLVLGWAEDGRCLCMGTCRANTI